MMNAVMTYLGRMLFRSARKAYEQNLPVLAGLYAMIIELQDTRSRATISKNGNVLTIDFVPEIGIEGEHKPVENIKESDYGRFVDMVCEQLNGRAADWGTLQVESMEISDGSLKYCVRNIR